MNGAFFAGVAGVMIGGGYVLWKKVRSTRDGASPDLVPVELSSAPPVAPRAEAEFELSGEDELVLAERLQGYVAATVADRLGIPDARVRASLRRLKKAGHPV